MSPERVRMLLRRRELQLEATRQRAELLRLIDDIDAVAERVDSVRARLVDSAMAAGRHPVLLALLGAAVLVWRPAGVLRWAQRGLIAWQALRRLRAGLEPLLARLAGLKL